MLQGANGSYNVAHVERAVLFDEADLQSVHVKSSAASGVPSAAGGLPSAVGGLPSSAGGEESSKLIDTKVAEEGASPNDDGEKEANAQEDREEEEISSDGGDHAEPADGGKMKPSHLGGFPSLSK